MLAECHRYTDHLAYAHRAYYVHCKQHVISFKANPHVRLIIRLKFMCKLPPKSCGMSSCHSKQQRHDFKLKFAFTSRLLQLYPSLRARIFTTTMYRYLPLAASCLSTLVALSRADTFISPASPFVTTTGRMSPTFQFDFQNAGAVVTISGASYLQVSLLQTNPGGVTASVTNRLGAWIETSGQVDVLSSVFTQAGSFNYTLVAGLHTSSTYTIGWKKISEPAWNEGTTEFPEWLVFQGFYTDGVAVTQQYTPPKRKLEFIGDSLTAGTSQSSLED
jgi:hypothetical protein